LQTNEPFFTGFNKLLQNITLQSFMAALLRNPVVQSIVSNHHKKKQQITHSVGQYNQNITWLLSMIATKT